MSATKDLCMSVCRSRHNCFKEVGLHFIRCLAYSAKVYTSVHLIQTLIYKRASLISEPFILLKNLIKKILKSVGFFSYYTFGIKFSLCFCNWMKNGKFDIFSIMFMIFASSFSSFFENSSRITDYTIFTLPRSIEGLWDLLEKLKLVKSLPYARELIFAVSMGIALIIYKNKKEDLPVSYKNLIHLVFGKNLNENEN